MEPNEHCEICALEEPQNLIVETPFWRTFLAYDQSRLGTCITACREHRRALVELTAEEWKDWERLLKKLHPALYRAFGPANINVACLMNGAFEASVPEPHVHWWSIPRYDVEVTFAGKKFRDEHYPHLTFELDEKTRGRADLDPVIRAAIIAEILKGM